MHLANFSMLPRPVVFNGFQIEAGSDSLGYCLFITPPGGVRQVSLFSVRPNAVNDLFKEIKDVTGLDVHAINDPSPWPSVKPTVLTEDGQVKLEVSQ